MISEQLNFLPDSYLERGGDCFLRRQSENSFADNIRVAFSLTSNVAFGKHTPIRSTSYQYRGVISLRDLCGGGEVLRYFGSYVQPYLQNCCEKNHKADLTDSAKEAWARQRTILRRIAPQTKCRQTEKVLDGTHTQYSPQYRSNRLNLNIEVTLQPGEAIAFCAAHGLESSLSVVKMKKLKRRKKVPENHLFDLPKTTPLW